MSSAGFVSLEGISQVIQNLRAEGSPSPKPCDRHSKTRSVGRPKTGVNSPRSHTPCSWCRSQVARGKILVDPDIPGCRCRLDAKVRHQVLAANLSDKAQAQLNERKSVALALGQVCKLFVGHPGCHFGLLFAG